MTTTRWHEEEDRIAENDAAIRTIEAAIRQLGKQAARNFYDEHRELIDPNDKFVEVKRFSAEDEWLRGAWDFDTVGFSLPDGAYDWYEAAFLKELAVCVAKPREG